MLQTRWRRWAWPDPRDLAIVPVAPASSASITRSWHLLPEKDQGPASSMQAINGAHAPMMRLKAERSGLPVNVRIKTLEEGFQIGHEPVELVMVEPVTGILVKFHFGIAEMCKATVFGRV